jgi:hypothetical protein
MELDRVRTIKHVLTRVLQCATSLMVVHWSGTAPGAQGGRSVESVARWRGGLGQGVCCRLEDRGDEWCLCGRRGEPRCGGGAVQGLRQSGGGRSDNMGAV